MVEKARSRNSLNIKAFGWLAAGILASISNLYASFDGQYRTILSSATPSQLYEFFREMPKGGILHLHSEYAVSPEFWLKIATGGEAGGNEYFTKVREAACADEPSRPLLFVTVQRATWSRLSACEQRNFRPLPALSSDQRAEWLRALVVDTPADGRRKFFEGIVPRLDDLCEDPNLMLVAIRKIIEDAASEHVLYLEMQFDPTSLHDPTGSPSSPEVTVAAIRKLLDRESVTVRFQLAAYRYARDPHQELLNAFQFVAKHRDLWVGVNLLGQEGQPGGELSRFAAAFEEMRARFDVPFSLHAGEVDSSGHEVREAVMLGAARVGHAVNLITDPDTMSLMRERHVAIETSLVSNKLLEYTPDLSKHPLPVYLHSGIPICLNTDDPGAFGSTLTDEFYLAATTYRLSWTELEGLARNSIRYAFVDRATKARLESELDKNLSNFETKMSGGNWRAKLRRLYQPSDFALRFLR